METIQNMLNDKLVFQIGNRVIEVNFYDIVMPFSGMSLLYFLFWRKSGFGDPSELKMRNIQSTDKENPDDESYKPENIKIPVIKGWLCTVYRKLSRSLALQKFLLESAKKEGELDLFCKLILPDHPTFYPIITPVTQANDTEPIDLEAFVKPSCKDDDFHFNTISDYYTQYRNGISTPLEVARNIISSIEDTFKKNLRIIVWLQEDHKRIILQKAAESTERWSKKSPLSIFDGVPVAVKDEIFLANYPCLDGLPMKVAGNHITTEDEEGWMVQKLRKGGAIFIGVSNMHQMGIGITGINASEIHGTARNPYNTDFPCGGSSSGSAAAVSSGLCPIALGADGGGSIRIPSSVCGIVGAKNTFGRMSCTDMYGGCDTVIHPGPLCATVQDARLAYGFLAGPDEKYEIGMVQPLPTLSNAELPKGIKIGVDWNFFNDSSPEIRDSCKSALDFLVQNYGMEIVDISIPELSETSRAHVITILSEMQSYAEGIFRGHHDDINIDTEIYLRLAGTFTSSDYFKAQQQRTRAINILKRLFKSVDVMITPTCGNLMPKLEDEMLKYGYLDTKRTSEVIRFCVMGNLVGNPSITVPVGYSSDNLPIGILIHTPWWEEDLMYRMADAMKNHLELRKPEIYYDVLYGALAKEGCDSEDGKLLISNEIECQNIL